MIKYKFAKNINEELINISEVRKSSKGSKYYCIGCNNELIPRKGKVKTHHFAHKKAISCPSETYLHLLGKKLFFDSYLNCLNNKRPFIIEIYQDKTCDFYEKVLKQVCHFNANTSKFDLTKYFDNIQMERTEGSFIPDLVLFTEGIEDRIFIEIAVTHKSSELKLDSDYRIIEIEVEDDEGFEPIRNNLLSVKDSNINFVNFQNKRKVGSFCKGNCQKSFDFFRIDKNGRGILTQNNLKEINHFLKQQLTKVAHYYITEDLGDYYRVKFKYFVAKSYKENIRIKNCFICRYHAQNNSWYYENARENPVFCKFLKIKCNSNHAVSCEYFKVEMDYVDGLIELRKKLIEHLKEDEKLIEADLKKII